MYVNPLHINSNVNIILINPCPLVELNEVSKLFFFSICFVLFCYVLHNFEFRRSSQVPIYSRAKLRKNLVITIQDIF